MEIVAVKREKKRYLPLLLLADEQEDMIDRYLDRGALYVLQNGGNTIALCVVTDEGGGVLELKNLAVAPPFQRQGYGARLVSFLLEAYGGRFSTLQVGTGDSPLTLPFYEALGFRRTHTVPNFFLTHYHHPIFECGRQLVDMVYLEKPIPPPTPMGSERSQAR